MSQQQFYLYTAIEGDRWDWIATQFYARPYDYVGIIRANPQYQGVHLLPAGARILVPIVEATTTTNNSLPPWKR